MSAASDRDVSARPSWIEVGRFGVGAVILLGSIVVWLASASSLAIGAAGKLEEPSSFAAFTGILALVLAKVSVALYRRQRRRAAIWATTCIAWLASGPQLVTDWAHLAGSGPLGRAVILAVVLAAAVIVAVAAALIAPHWRRAEYVLAAGMAVARLAPGPAEVETLSHRARHEAAHAVVATALGARVTSVDVTLRPGGIGGTCTHQTAPDWSVTDRSWAQLVIAVAANVSDLDNGVCGDGATSDIEKALHHLAAIISTGRLPTGYSGALRFDDLLAGARDLAAEILEVNEAAIHMLMELLEATAGEQALRGEGLGEVRALVIPHRWQEVAVRRTAPVDNP